MNVHRQSPCSGDRQARAEVRLTRLCFRGPWARKAREFFCSCAVWSPGLFGRFLASDCLFRRVLQARHDHWNPSGLLSGLRSCWRCSHAPLSLERRRLEHHHCLKAGRTPGWRRVGGESSADVRVAYPCAKLKLYSKSVTVVCSEAYS